jgi:hypothetical protein
MSIRLLAALAAAATLAAACSYSETRTVAAPMAADDSCVAYGYSPGTTAYDVCVEREAAARRRGRVPANYPQARIVADSQDACLSYGLTRGTAGYDRCVQREIDYRRPI